MTRELYVSSTPHETKVGMVEDDLLAEIYLERENEYTLAGSIYKGRVTRVLPGMQSAFVDIGLERDAFLYVSDFMELPEDDEVDEIPTTARRRRSAASTKAEPASRAERCENRDVPTGRSGPSPQRERSGTIPIAENQREGRTATGATAVAGADAAVNACRRPNSLAPPLERHAAPPPRQSESNARYGPPPGYQPMVLPGESISKYRGRTQTAAAATGAAGTEQQSAAMASAFPEDEPLFAEPARKVPREMNN